MQQDNANKILDKNDLLGRGALWIGNLASATSKSFIEQENIKTIITAAVGQPASYLNQQIFHKVIPIIDEPSYVISKHFNDLNRIIDKQLNLGSVLVHCAAGISRSATIVIAYLICNLNWSLEQSFEYVKQKRKKIKPNSGFMEQLKHYEEQIKLKKMRQHQLKLKMQQNSFSRKELQRITQIQQLNPQCLFHLQKCRSISKDKERKTIIYEKIQQKNHDNIEKNKDDLIFQNFNIQKQQSQCQSAFRIKTLQLSRVKTEQNDNDELLNQIYKQTQFISPRQKSLYLNSKNIRQLKK